MIAILRLIALAIGLATVVFVTLWLGLLAAKRAELSEDWSEKVRPGSREDYVRAGLDAYRARVMPRLAAAIYGTALVSLALIGYLAIKS